MGKSKRCKPMWGSCSLPSGHKGQHWNWKQCETGLPDDCLETFADDPDRWCPSCQHNAERPK